MCKYFLCVTVDNVELLIKRQVSDELRYDALTDSTDGLNFTYKIFQKVSGLVLEFEVFNCRELRVPNDFPQRNFVASEAGRRAICLDGISISIVLFLHYESEPLPHLILSFTINVQQLFHFHAGSTLPVRFGSKRHIPRPR